MFASKKLLTERTALENSLERCLIGGDSHVSVSATDFCVLGELLMKEADTRLTLHLRGDCH